MAKPGRKSEGRGAPRLGTWGERVARERAARRRAAKDRDARGIDEPEQASDETAEPEIVEIPQSDLMNEVSVLAAVIAAGLARSHPEARRLFRDDGILVNDQPILSDKAKLGLRDVTADGSIKLGVGTRRHVLLRPV